jgi:tetratricopeptide (TPR) repeat protein
MIRVAIRDFYYVIGEANRLGERNFVMLPELYYRAGDGYVQLREYAQAIEEFEKSRDAKPDYWPPYVAQAQVHMTLGMRNEARAILEQGLQLMPGEANLQSALDRLAATGDLRGSARLRSPSALEPAVSAAQ